MIDPLQSIQVTLAQIEQEREHEDCDQLNMEIEQIQKMITEMKNEIIVALDEKLEVKLDKKLDKTLSKINEKVTKNKTAIVELQDKQKDNIEKVDNLTARMNVDNEILVDNTERLDKIDKDN